MNKSIQGALAAAMLVTLGASADTYKWIGTDATARFTDLANWTNETAEAMATTLPAADDIVKMTSLAANPTITVEEGDAVSVLRLKLGGKTYGQFATLAVNGGSFSLLETNWDDWGDNKSFLGWHNGGALRVNGGLATLGRIYVGGQYGKGAVYVSGGELSVTDSVRFGYFTENEAVLDVSSGSASFSGQADFGRACFTQTGGSVSFLGGSSGSFNLGTKQGHTATYKLLGGTLAVDSGYMSVGKSASGLVEQTGGSVTFSAEENKWCQHFPRIGDEAGSSGEWNISGGTVMRPRLRFWGYQDSYLTVGYKGTGVLRVSGTGVLTVDDWLRLGHDAAAAGTLELNGGVASVRTFKGGDGESRIVFNGGTLAPTVANATWFQDVGTLEVTGGAVISNDVAVTIALPLVSGRARDGGLVKKGSSALTLSAANTFNGPVVIEAGTLALGCDDALPSGAAVTVRTGAVFETNGHAFSGVVYDEATGRTIVSGSGVLPGVEVRGERILKTAKGWYDAKDATTLTLADGTDHVTRWANKGAAGAMLDLEAGGSSSPSYFANGVVNFTNSWDFVSMSALGLQESSPRTLLAVSYMDRTVYDALNPNHEAWNGVHFYPLAISGSGESGAFCFKHWMGDMSGYWDTAAKDDGTGKYVQVADVFSLPENAWATQMLWSDGATVCGCKVTAAGARTDLESAALVGTLGTQANGRLMIGRDIQYGWHSYGAVAEAAYFDRTLTADEVEEVNAYVAQKWYGAAGIPLTVTLPSVELSENATLDVSDTEVALGTLSGMGSVEGANALLTVGAFAPVCGDLTVNVPVAEPAEGEYVTLTITINPANGDCGTLVIPEGYDLSKIDLVVTGCDNLVAEDMPLFFKGKAGESLAPFHSVTTDAKRGLKVLYDASTGEVRGRLKGGLVLIVK